MSTLQDQVIIVTGAGRGLGRAYALDLARRGARVIVNTRPRTADTSGSAEAVVDEIRALGGQGVAAPLAVEEPDSGERLVSAALDAFGRIDGLLNNAGAPEARTLHKQTAEAFRQVFEVNFFGTLTPTLPIYRHLRAQGSGRILVSTSAAGLHGVHGMAAYSSSKAALIGLMKVIALEGAAHGVACNAIAPYAATGMTAAYLDEISASRMNPDRVTPIASWLMSPACTLNGQTLVAGAGAVRPAIHIEGTGLLFPDAPTLDDLSAQATALMQLNEWNSFGDGNAAFEHLMEAVSQQMALHDLR